MAIVFPFVILATVTVVQASMWYYARNIALTAAREGVAVGRSYDSSPAEGASHARGVLDRIAGDTLGNSSVSTTGSTGQRVRIQVSGTAPSLIPGLSGLSITQSASGAVERFTTPEG